MCFFPEKMFIFMGVFHWYGFGMVPGQNLCIYFRYKCAINSVLGQNFPCICGFQVVKYFYMVCIFARTWIQHVKIWQSKVDDEKLLHRIIVTNIYYIQLLFLVTPSKTIWNGVFFLLSPIFKSSRHNDHHITVK